MCEPGNTTDVLVLIPFDHSSTGRAKWVYKPVDSCIADIVNTFNSNGIYTAGCCCGHGKGPGSIVFQDGPELTLPRVWIRELAAEDDQATRMGTQKARR